jgi:uncharacterized protein (TIGR03435 family)
MPRSALPVAVLMASIAWPQTGPTRTFEVASVKAVDYPVGPHAVSLLINHERLNIDAAALRQMIGLAFAIQRVRVQGGPPWIDEDLYDVVAKAASPDVTRDEIREMLQALLIERFKLSVHRETKELPEYTLVPWKDGPKLKPAGTDEKTGITPDGSPNGGRRFTFQKMPFTTLVNFLANTLNSPVIDKSGVPSGLYTYTLQWTESVGNQRTEEVAPLDSGPSLFKALQEQLGLKLEVKKVPIEVLIIDHIEKATAN